MSLLAGPPNAIQQWEEARGGGVMANRVETTTQSVSWGPQAPQAQAGPSQGQAGPTQHNPYQPVMSPPGPSQGVQGTQVHPMSVTPMTWQDRVNFGQDTMSGGTQQYTQEGNAPYQGPYPGQNQGPTQTQALGGHLLRVYGFRKRKVVHKYFRG